MVIEISDAVCSCHSASPRELKIPSAACELATIPAVVSEFLFAIPTIFPTVAARSSAVMAAVSAKYRVGTGASPVLPSPAGIGSKSSLGCCTLASFSDACTTRFKLSSSNLFVVARAVRFPNAVRTETTTFSSAIF